MELQAAIEALSVLSEPSDVDLTTDSEYVAIGITAWILKWRENHWQTAGRKPVKNRELWERLESLCARHRVTWNVVKGHSGDPSNERCDLLANTAAGILATAPEPWWRKAKDARN